MLFSAAGLSDRHADLGGPAEVPPAHGHVDADGCYSAINGRAEPDGPVDDAPEHDAGREHDEQHVDERHGHGRVPGHGLDGHVHVPRQLSQRPSAGRLPLVVTLGPGQPGQEEPREDIIGGARLGSYRDARANLGSTNLLPGGSGTLSRPLERRSTTARAPWTPTPQHPSRSEDLGKFREELSRRER